MNTSLVIRYAVELFMLVPAAAFSIIPVYDMLRVKRTFMFGILSVLLILAIVGGAVLCAVCGVGTNTILFPAMAGFFVPYYICFDLPLPKKIFCFANAVLLCGFSATYTTFLTAPLELDNTDPMLTLRSGLICLGITGLIGLLFSRTLLMQFPELLNAEILDSAWHVLMIAPILTAAGVVWMNPVSAENVMTGRLRMISLVVLLSIPLVTLFLYHILWWLSKKISETAQLKYSYDLLKMEEKQYHQTLRYLQETRNARHDFRQHIHVIQEYLEAGETEKLKEYIAPLYQSVNRTHKMICSNAALDAIASHYDEAANARQVKVYWNIKVGEKLPVKESDLCAVVGNLVENAIRAACSLEGDDRLVNVRIGILQEETLVISIENAYRGTLTLDKNGLPVSNLPDHGIGLKSVKNIVERYKGSMEIETHNQLFRVSILMYAPD